METKMTKETTDTKAVEIENEEVEDEDLDAEVEEVEGEGVDDDEDAEETVAKKDLDKVQKALESERTITKERNAEIRKLRRELKAATEVTPEDVDSQKLVAEATDKANKFKDIAVRKEAALALSEAGAKVSTKRLIKLLDLADVEIDFDGNVDGLADAIAELKEESPEFFKSEDDVVVATTTTKRASVKRVGSADGGTKTVAQPKLTPAQMMLKEAGLKYN
jgi:hypothetical protein